MDSKPAIQSATLWVNAILPVIYLLLNQFAPSVASALTPELVVGIVALVNAVIRVVKTDKKISGVM